MEIVDGTGSRLPPPAEAQKLYSTTRPQWVAHLALQDLHALRVRRDLVGLHRDAKEVQQGLPHLRVPAHVALEVFLGGVAAVDQAMEQCNPAGGGSSRLRASNGICWPEGQAVQTMGQRNPAEATTSSEQVNSGSFARGS